MSEKNSPICSTIHARKEYKVALALDKTGKKGEAKEYYRKVAAYDLRPDDANQYFRGLALEALGKKNEAVDTYEKMLAAVNKATEGRRRLIGEGNFDPGRNFEAIRIYKRSLALAGLGKNGESEKQREEALKMDPLAELRAFSPPRAGW